MPRFTVRVELHNARSEDDYERLHEAMGRQGFSRTIEDANGVSRHLPTAEYNYEGAGSRSRILDLAKEAAAETGKKYSVLVTESNGRTWYNLPQV